MNPCLGLVGKDSAKPCSSSANHSGMTNQINNTSCPWFDYLNLPVNLYCVYTVDYWNDHWNDGLLDWALSSTSGHTQTSVPRPYFLKGSRATTLPPFPPLVSLSYTLDPIIRKSTHQMDSLMLMQEMTALYREKKMEKLNLTLLMQV